MKKKKEQKLNEKKTELKKCSNKKSGACVGSCFNIRDDKYSAFDTQPFSIGENDGVLDIMYQRAI